MKTNEFITFCYLYSQATELHGRRLEQMSWSYQLLMNGIHDLHGVIPPGRRHHECMLGRGVR